MIRHTLLFLGFYFLLSNSLLSQNLEQPACGMEQRLMKLAEKKPILLKEFDNYIEKSNEFSSSKMSDRNVITIPVIVHVIHGGEPIGNGSNISEEQILSQLNILNEDYRFMNNDKSQIPNAMLSSVGDTQLEFCLIKKDAAGNNHSGINRVKYENIPNIDYIEYTIKPQTIWNPKKFLNIWTVKMPEAHVLGYSYLPLPSILHTDQDGVVIAFNKFGKLGSQILGRTATHEIGHYLGLLHPWGSTESCSSDDGLTDTPNCSGPYFGCPSYPQVSCGTIDMSMNFMDYVDDRCMYMFSKQQGEKMRTVLSNERLALSTGYEYICNVATTTISSNSDITTEINMFPNPCQDYIQITSSLFSADQQVLVEIFSLNGKRHLQSRFFPNLLGNISNIDVSRLPNGGYLMKILTNGTISYKKLVIARN